jgi:hypothetical protein
MFGGKSGVRVGSPMINADFWRSRKIFADFQNDFLSSEFRIENLTAIANIIASSEVISGLRTPDFLYNEIL